MPEPQVPATSLQSQLSLVPMSELDLLLGSNSKVIGGTGRDNQNSRSYFHVYMFIEA